MQVFNDRKTRKCTLDKYRNREITETLTTGDKEITFEYPANAENIEFLKEEYYIRTKTDEYVIKEVEKGQDYYKITALLNVEDLEGMTFPYGFESYEQKIRACLEFAFEDTGWTVGLCSIEKLRTIRKEDSTNAWEVLKDALSTYRVECKIDSINKVVDIYEEIGSDKGCYFVDGLNLRSLKPKSDTYEFYTRIYPLGKDDINPEWLTGKDYIDNNQYSDKVKSFTWKDERYTNTTSLIEDATAKLEEVSKPYKAYTADVIDLAAVSEDYKDILSFCLGDTVTIISKKNNTKDKQRIVKITKYPESPEKNKIEISNAKKTFAQIQKESAETAKAEAVDISNRAVKKMLVNYYTKEEISTRITASKQEVELGVQHVLENYYTKETTDAVINLAKEGIEQSVSKKYATKDDVSGFATESEIKSMIEISEKAINLSVEEKLDAYMTESEAKSAIQTSLSGIELLVQGKVGTDEIISKINMSKETVAINAAKINLIGLVTANNNFKIKTDGSIEAINGKFTGTITGSTIQTAETGRRAVMDTTSSLRGQNGDTVYNILDMASNSSDYQMTIDAKNQLSIRTPKIAVINKSYGMDSGTAKEARTGSITYVDHVEKDKTGCKEMWVGSVYCTLPVFLSVRKKKLETICGFAVTETTVGTDRV